MKTKAEKAAYDRVYREANKEKLQKQSAAWRAANRSKVLSDKKVWAAENREKVLEKVIAWAKKNPDRAAENKARWASKNKDKVNRSVAKYRELNPEIGMYCRARRRAALAQATPKWADRKAIRDIYKKAAIYRQDGLDVHVDHVFPLQGELVCGLHVETNLEIISADINRKKSNKLMFENGMTKRMRKAEWWDA